MAADTYPLSRTRTVTQADTRVLAAILMLAILVGAAWSAAAQIIIPPAPTPATAPATEFSGARAMRYLQVLARAPHTVGSPAQAQVREHILQQIQDMGLKPAVQDTTAAVSSAAGVFASNPHNILVRIPGTASTGAVGVMAHYDSQPNTPAGTDNMAAVAGLLETMAAIQAGPRPTNDLIFILTDAEEADAQGADAFYTQHPWAKDIRVIVNFEGAGDTGASILMDLQPGSLQLINSFVAAVPHPVAYSALPGLLSIMPVGTDITVFTENGVPGISPMFGWHYRTTYHSRLESPARLNPGTLQHQGENALGLARYLAGLDLGALSARPGTGAGTGAGAGAGAVFFSVPPGLVIRYAAAAAKPLAVVAALGLVLTIALGLHRRRLTLRSLLAGCGVAVAGMLAPVVLAGLAWVALAGLHPEYWRYLMGAPYGADLYLLGMACLTVAASLGVFVLARRRLAVVALTAGALVLWLVPALLTAWTLQAMSYLFVWPVLLATLVLLGLVLRGQAPGEAGPIPASRAWIWPAGLALEGAMIILIVVPFALVLYLLIGFWFIAMQPAMPFIALPLLLLALMLTLFAPQMELLTSAFQAGRKPGPRRWPAPASAGLVALVFLAAGSFSSGASASQPLPNGVWYMLDADSGQAAWYSYGERPSDPWTAQFFPGPTQPVDLSQVYAATPGNPVPAGFRGSAPAAPLAPPQLVVKSDRVTDGQRTVVLHLASPRGARGLRLRASGVPVLAAEVNGVRRSEPAWAERQEWYLRYYGLTPQGIDLKLEVAPSARLSLQLTDQADGLPELPGVAYVPRTPDMMPFAIAQEYMPYPETNSVTKQFELQ